MGALRYKDTVQALAEALVEGSCAQRAHTTPVETADTGDAIIGFPTRFEFDETFQRGADRALIPIWVVAGLVGEEATLDELDRLTGDGDTSVKTVLESGEYGGLADVISDLSIPTGAVEIAVFSGGLRYVVPRFDVEVIS